MMNGEIVRLLRRQMQRRIRAVVAERRMARHAAPRSDDGEQGPEKAEFRTPQPVNG